MPHILYGTVAWGQRLRLSMQLYITPLIALKHYSWSAIDVIPIFHSIRPFGDGQMTFADAILTCLRSP